MNWQVFGAFWTTHHVCALIIYIFTVIHGISRILGPPSFYIWLLPAAFLFIIDRAISFGRTTIRCPIVEVELLPSGVTKVTTLLQ